MAKLLYVDETGSSGGSWEASPFLTVVGVVVGEEKVRPLAESLRSLTVQYRLAGQRNAEFHGQDLFQGTGLWKERLPDERRAAYEGALGILEALDLEVAHATINRRKLHARYRGEADGNAYRLALQFLLEKVSGTTSDLVIVVADQSKEQELDAIRMVAELQEWGLGEVPGRRLTNIIDCLHFVDSRHSPGVQLADLAAFVLGRRRRVDVETDSRAEAAMESLARIVWGRTSTWRQAWPS